MMYLAQPYSHPVKSVVDTRVLWGMGAAAALAAKNWDPYAPIVHWHEVATKFNLPTDHEFWRALDHRMIAHCDSFAILTLPGWNQSLGVAEEWVAAEEFHKPAYFVNVVAWHTATDENTSLTKYTIPTIDIGKTTYRYIEEAFINGQDSTQRGLDTEEAGDVILG